MKKGFTGFTLAEVLVTLAVIGVVAALTIPSLQKSFEFTAYRSQLKTAYSILQQATMSVMSDNNGTMMSLCGPSGAEPDGSCTTAEDASDYVAGLYAQYLRYSGDICSTWDKGSGECWYTEDIKSYANGCNWGDESAGGGRIILNNGMLLGIYYEDGACTGSVYSMGCGYIWADVNGRKGPNRWGYDVYMFEINENRVVPTGSDGTKYDTDWCDPNGSGSEGSGWGCTYVRLME